MKEDVVSAASSTSLQPTEGLDIKARRLAEKEFNHWLSTKCSREFRSALEAPELIPAPCHD